MDEQKLPNGDVKKNKKKHRENFTENSKENLSGCCQGVNNESFVAEMDQNRVRKKP